MKWFLPSTYLVLPLSAKANSKAIWNPVIERLEKRLTSWKGRYLSKGGKLVLLRSMLSSMPICFLSLVAASVLVISRIEKIQRGFPWQHDKGSHKINWVNWPAICKPLKQGGLGIRLVKAIQ